MSDLAWNRIITDQMDFWWHYMFRPRVEGLTTEEYLWEPTPGGWSLRAGPDGRLVLDDGDGTEPDPAPVTTIAWRIGHLVTGLARRSADQFGSDPVDVEGYPHAATGPAALAQLDEEYSAWRAGVEALGEEGLARPCGPTEGPFADNPLADLVLHVYRELLCHGAEICLLRDLHATGA